jgi:hypothetical protein
MKKIILIVLSVLIIILIAGCAAGPNSMVDTPREDGKTAGFLRGLWHGFIALFTFIISIFTDKVSVYEVHNTGGWYDFGFILGIMIFFGGGGRAGAGSRNRSR